MVADNQLYSAGELSKLANVSIRTLHYYDEIGLLKAKRNPLNGYRQYNSHDAVFLQQIILYRNMQMPLDEIKAIMTGKDFDLMQALKKQYALLLQRQSQTQIMINKIEVTMSALRGEKNIDIMFREFSPEKVEEWKNNLVGKDNLAAMYEAYGRVSESEAIEMSAESKAWTERYAEVIARPANDAAVQKLVAEAYVISNRAMSKVSTENKTYQLDYERYIQVAMLNKTNPVIREIYNHYENGLAEHLYNAMMYFAENTLKHNEAEWLKRT